MRGIDHLRVGGSPVPSKLPEQIFPDAATRPPHKAIIDRRRRAILGRAVAPAAAAFQHMHDAANDPAIILAFDPTNIRRQVRFDPFPLHIFSQNRAPLQVIDGNYERMSGVCLW